jgi:prepilin-type N-terminal cleavage/methylation domain-containing protein
MKPTSQKHDAKFHGAGFTMLEMLIGLSILGVIMVAFFRIVGSTIDSSNELNQRNDLIQDAQVAQQIVTAKIQEACYIYPNGQVINLGNGYTRQRSVGTGAPSPNWTVGTHPILAMLLKPDPNATGTNVGLNRFVAYYPVLRSTWVTSASESQNPGDDSANRNNWILVQLQAFVPAATWTGTTCAPNAAAVSTWITGSTSQGRMLVDNVQPTNATSTNYADMFTTTLGTPPAPPNVTFRIKYQRDLRVRSSSTSGAGIVRFPPTSDANGDPMQVTISVQNDGL